MAGPTSIAGTKQQRAQDLTLANNSTGGVTTGQMKFLIDSDNVSRGDAYAFLEQCQELVLEGKWPLF